MRPLLFLLLLPGALAAQDFPLIKELSAPRDINFRQHQELLGQYYRKAGRGDPLPDPVIFSYLTTKDDSFFTLSARFGVPYETLATLNALDRADSLVPGLTLLISSVPGIFVPQESQTDLGLILNAFSQEARKDPVVLKIPLSGVVRTFHFYPGGRFHPVERAYFLGILFRFPLGGAARLTSRFGLRKDPFSGHNQFHNGIDLAAPTGTEVLAAREGTVKALGEDRIYGRYVVIAHPGGYETLYGHLKSQAVSLNDRVSSGTLLGQVGTTGMSTGPHLHFEIRRQGHPQDPVPLLSP